MSEKSRRTVTLDKPNDTWLQNQDNASAVVNQIVTQLRKVGGRHTAGLDLQIQQKRRELETAKQRVQNVKQDLDELEAMRRRMEQEEDPAMEQAREKLSDVPDDPQNPAIQNWANKLGVDERELIQRLNN